MRNFLGRWRYASLVGTLSLALLLSSLSSLLFSQNSNAASSFDNTIHKVSEIYVGSTNITTTWRDQINSKCTSTVSNRFNLAVDSGAVFAVVTYEGSTQNVDIQFDTDPPVGPVVASFSTIGSSSQVNQLQYGWDYGIRLQLDGGIGCYDFGSLGGGSIAPIASFNTSTGQPGVRPFIFTGAVAYPSGYTGETFAPPIPDSTEVPDIFMSSMSDFVGQFSDRRFFTFDGVPFTCGEFVPQINVEVWTTHGTSDEVLLDTLSTTASSQFSYTFPPSVNTQDYRIVSYYSCPEYNFTEAAYYDFQINSSGGLVNATPCSAELFCQLNLPTYGLTETILAPLTFISQIPSATCSPLILPMPNGISNITLPCMTPIYAANFGAILLIFQTIFTGLFAYYVSLKIFGNVKQLTNPRDDQVETVKL